MADRTDDILRHFPTLLRRWDGSIARMWELTISHQTLRLRLEQHGRVGNLLIACIDPQFIHGPTEWKGSQLEITLRDDVFLVEDTRAGVEVRACHVELVENSKPTNAFTIATTSGGTG